jgi:nitrate reductase NapD
MNICGVLVHAIPSELADVLAALNGFGGVEVHATAADSGRIVLTVEDAGGVRAFDTITQIHRLDGIVAASLVYHHFEPADSAAHTI